MYVVYKPGILTSKVYYTSNLVLSKWSPFLASAKKFDILQEAEWVAMDYPGALIQEV